MDGAVDSDLDQTFEIVERDTVPAPPSQQNDSYKERLSTLLKWLQPTDFLSPGSEFMKHLHSYVPGTGDWIHKSPVFCAWANSDSNTNSSSGHDHNGSSCLHVRGLAGTGKSVFSASTVRQLQESGSIVLFFFFRQIVDKNHSANYLIRDFAAQLLPHCPALVTTLTTISQDHAISGSESSLIWPVLIEALTMGLTKNVYCVVDALDEMDDGDFEGMTHRLVELGTVAPGKVRVMMTSRPLPKIEQALSNSRIAKLKLDPALLYPDVARYVDARMATLDPPLSNDKNELVKQTICERAKGLFLHARLIADNLAEGLRDKHITEETLPDSLDRLPRTLQDVYEGMLKEHAHRSGVTAEQQAKVLMCVTHASRPLRLIELGSLLSNMLHISLGQGKDLVRQSCGRLLELLEDESVSVIHHSFTEFLHDATRKANADAFPVLDDTTSHEMLSVLLLEFLDGCPHFDVTLDDHREVNYDEHNWRRTERKRRDDLVTNLRITRPLVSYAAENLAFHLKKASAQPPNAVREALTRYLCPEKPAFETLILMNWEGRLSASFNVFHLATAVKPPLAMPLKYLKRYSEEEAESRRQTALSFAFRGDNPGVIQAFMPFIPLTEVNKCFHQVDNVENIEAILNTGKVDIGCFQDGKTRLFRAAERHNLDLIKLLLKHGADPNGRSARESLYTYGQISLQVDNEQGPTPLHAFCSPDERCVLMKEDVNKAEECVRVLVAAGADVNATIRWKRSVSGQDLTPLHLAVLKTDTAFGYWGSLDKSEEILTRALLLQGADPNARTDRGETPMHLANPEKSQLLDLLVEFEADINAVNDVGRTPLLAIIDKMGHSFASFSLFKLKADALTFQKFLDLGADVHATDKNGDNVFHHIMHSIEFFSDAKVFPFIQQLLDAGVDLNQRNGKGHPPVWKYRQCDRTDGGNRTDSDEELLRMLVEAGMDLSIRGSKTGKTILGVIGGRFKENNVMQMFIRLGAQLSTGDGKSLLHEATKDYKKGADWFRYMISIGTKPDVLGPGGDTLIHSVLRSAGDESKFLDIIQVLVEAGVSPLTKNKKGETALHVVKSLRILERVLESPLFKELDLNQQDANGFTPLHHAVSLGEIAVKSLLRAGADPTVLAAVDLSPLHVACREGAASIVSLLLSEYQSRGVLEKYVNLLGEGMAPLHYACRSGRPESVWELLRNGANPWLPDVDGLMPLHSLAEFDDLEDLWRRRRIQATDIITMLQQAGVDLNVEAVVEDHDGKTKTVTPMDMAVEERCWDMVRALLTRGVKARDSHLKSPEFILATDKHKAAETARNVSSALPSPQHGTLLRGRWSVLYEKHRPLSEEKLYYLADGQAILDIQAKVGDEGNRLDQLDPLKYALEDGDYDSIKEYALLGGNVLALDRYEDNTLLHLLVEGGYADLLEYFADKVHLFEAQDWVQTDEENCGTLLGTACERDLPSLHIIRLLVEKIGVDVNAVYNRRGYCYKIRGGTALHILAGGSRFWQIEALEYLVSKGANIEALNKDGMTPLLAALDQSWPDGHWREETLKVLLRHGANVNATVCETEGSRGYTSGLSALELSDRGELTRMLVENGADTRRVPGLIARMVVKWNDALQISVLLEAGLDPNELPIPRKEGEDVRYALHEACRPSTTASTYSEAELHSRKEAIAGLLLSAGADPFATYPDGRCLLHSIIDDQGQLDNLLPRLSQTDINRKESQHGRSLLVSACVPTVRVGPETYGREPPCPSIVPSSVLGLLGKGADALGVDDEGRTPLHWLCTLPGKYDEEQQKAFISLVEHGPAAVNMADNQGCKPLHLALAMYSDRRQESLFAIKHLISAGANVSEPDSVTGNSILHQLAPRLVGHAERAAEATKLFREISTSVDINTRNKSSETPVMSFAAAGWEGTRDPTGKVSHPKFAIANDVNHAIALSNFIDLGADLTAVDARGQTLLHITASREIPTDSSDWDQRDDVISAFEKLMELGVDPRREDAELRTAIDVAVARNVRGIMRLFREKVEKKVEESDS
ncbi:putative ankyrin repeat protein [Trichoderma atroviride IMI 206040]|uniref:Ankyrin repeat protein n=1 Tax=Hypocrea atroviridis (strain ATCC 20476 / IMI 206040) TaxID=452589 RepID=G9NWZ7_HYPAI|nr:putative ankyrin repeat protein [Trichoderma atroviride IMI 206040]EHK45526.1 putative ankyrin repeat protein [Trichoderma atroviride IMI 206040]